MNYLKPSNSPGAAVRCENILSGENGKRRRITDLSRFDQSLSLTYSDPSSTPDGRQYNLTPRQEMEKQNGQCQPHNETLSLRNFSSVLTHELANPLNGMLMSVKLLQRNLASNPDCIETVSDLLVILSSEIDRLVSLLEEIRSGRVLLNLDLQPTILATEIKDFLVLQSAYYEEHRIQVEQNVPTDLPLIMADKGKLRQILLNLCKNAVEAMSHGGTLTLRSYASEEWVCLEVADTGEGIPEAMPVFETYVTNKPQGSGLGMAIVQEILKQHNGTISYTSQVGKGTTFHLKFPIQTG